MSLVSEILTSTYEIVRKEIARIVPVHRWATVTSVSPLRIRFDDQTQPLAATPGKLVSGLQVGDRVDVRHRSPGQPLITGIAGGGDTGWVDAPLEPDYQNDGGTAGRLQFRRVGGTIWVRGGTDGPRVENAYTTVARVPDGFPAPEIHHRVGVFGGGGRVAGLEIGPDRTIKQVIRDPIASTWISAATSYPAS